jgi:deoxycytidylate deaminase
MANTNYIFAGVFPTSNSPTCKEVGCEIEYSAPTTGIIPPYEAFHPHCVRNIHAEQRAIIIAAKYGIATQNAIMFSVLKPCYQCTKHIIAAGIIDIFYAGKAYDEQRTQDILAASGVFCTKLDVGLEYGD